jgi:phosphoribosylamine---glycine ligase
MAAAMATIPAMKILVLGAGGREHALAWKLSRSPQRPEVICAPGNGGIAREFPCREIPSLGTPEGVEAAAQLARALEADLTVVGPEAPLALGIADRFTADGLRVFGPTKEAARLEASKVFAKEFLDRHEIPTSAFRSFDNPTEAKKFVEKLRLPVVIKADGLAEGKGAFVARERNEALSAVDAILVQRRFGAAGSRLIVEDFLAGSEMSLQVLTDGENYLPLETARDYKAVRDGDQGPNTGGMGSYSPLRSLEDPVLGEVMDRIVGPTLSGLQSEGIRFRGILYFGLMLTAEGPCVLEFNVRFGDPEIQPIVMRLQSDLLDLLLSLAEGRLEGTTVEWDSRPALCVVAASGGYPGPYESGFPISGLDEAEAVADGEDLKVFFAGVRAAGAAAAGAVAAGAVAAGAGSEVPPEGGTPELLTSGGRVLGVTSLGADLSAARRTAYEALSKIHFERMAFRKDIGAVAVPAV